MVFLREGGKDDLTILLEKGRQNQTTATASVRRESVFGTEEATFTHAYHLYPTALYLCVKACFGVPGRSC